MRARPGAALALALCFTSASAATASTPEAAFSTVEVLNAPTSETLLGVSFPDADHGFAVGALGVIVATLDGGKTWVQQRRAQSSAPVAAASGQEYVGAFLAASFSDPLHGWAVGSGNVILSTADGGATWVKREVPGLIGQEGGSDPENGPRNGFLDVAFTDARTGYVVGANGVILSTTDGGATWQRQGDERYGFLRSVSFPDSQHGRAVGTAPPDVYVMLETADGGRTWSADPEVDVGPAVAGANFEAVSFLDARRGYIAGTGGRIFGTSDGGRNWTVQRKDTTEIFYGLAFGDTRRGAAVGLVELGAERKAALVTTGDGGETWAPRPIKAGSLWDVDFATPTTAYAVGCEVYATTGLTRRCQKSLIVRITFPSTAQGGGGGGFAVPLPFLVVGAVLVAGLSWILVLRRRPGSERH